MHLQIPVDKVFDEDFTGKLKSICFDIMEESKRNQLDSKEVMSKADASKFVGVSVSTLEKWIRDGLPLVTVLGRKFILKKSLLDWLKTHEN